MAERKKAGINRSKITRTNAASTGTKKADSSENSKKNQVLSVVIFAFAVFFGFLVLIKGESVWLALHNFILGLLGGVAVAWSLLLFYVSFMVAESQPSSKSSWKIILSLAVI